MNKRCLLVFVMGVIFLITGCGSGQEEKKNIVNDLSNGTIQNEDNKENSNDQEVLANQEIDLNSANLEGIILQMKEQGFTVNATIIEEVDGGGEVASAQVDGNDDSDNNIDVSYNEKTIFKLVEINRENYEQVVETVSQDEVKLDSTVMIWGTYEGYNLQADQVAVIRFIGD